MIEKYQIRSDFLKLSGVCNGADLKESSCCENNTKKRARLRHNRGVPAILV